MVFDSLTSNPNPLPKENASVFKLFIQSQDEAWNFNLNSSHFTSPKDFKVGIKQRTFGADSAFCRSMFCQTEKAKVDFQPQVRSNYHSDWMFFTFLFCFLFSAIFIFKNSKRISQLLKAFLAPHYTNQLVRDGNLMREFFIYPLLLVYLTSVFLMISFLLTNFFHLEIGLRQGLVIFSVIVLYFLFKIFVINIIGSVFQTRKETYEYLTNFIIFSLVFGMFLFPFVFFLIYITPSFSLLFSYIILAMFILNNLYRNVRGLMIGFSSERYNLYYLFLYLCTIEILPLGISVKLLITFYLTGDFLK